MAAPAVVKERRRFHVWRGGPVPPGSDAITLWSLIIVRRRAADDEQLIRHEAVHVDQWRAFGVFGFHRRSRSDEHCHAARSSDRRFIHL